MSAIGLMLYHLFYRSQNCQNSVEFGSYECNRVNVISFILSLSELPKL